MLVRFLIACSLILSVFAAISGSPIAIAQGLTQWTHTTLSDFSGCSQLTNTRVSNTNGGEVRLAAVLEDYFDSPNIDFTRWVTGQTFIFGSVPPTVTNGILSLNASFISSTISITQPTRVFESRTRFRVPPPNTGYGDIGFGRQPSPGCTPGGGCPPGDNRLFITNDANLVRANARNGQDPVTNVDLPGVDPALWHVYRIEYGQTATHYYVDGTFAVSITLPSTYAPYVWLYTLNPGSTVEVDWARIDYYPHSTGQFHSCTIDAGQTTTWGSLTWSSTVPAGTSVSFETRSSANGTNWSSWSAPITTGGTLITSPANRYLQYRITFITSDPIVSPEVDRVTVYFNGGFRFFLAVVIRGH